jgi:hypothetical protein
MQPKDISRLLDKYFEGETSLEEERILRQYFTSKDVAPELAMHKPLFIYESSMQAQESPDLPDDLFTDEPAQNTPAHVVLINENRAIEKPVQDVDVDRSSGITFFGTWAGRIAAGFALLVAGFGLGVGFTHYEGAGISADTDTGRGQQLELVENNHVLLSAYMGSASASERIQAIHTTSQQEEWNEVVVHKLISIMNFDDNVNVRLAASEALMYFGDEPVVRQAMINSLSIQSDPAMQITLIEMLVALKERGAISALQQIALSDDNMDVVKQKAAQGMGKLM